MTDVVHRSPERSRATSRPRPAPTAPRIGRRAATAIAACVAMPAGAAVGAPVSADLSHMVTSATPAVQLVMLALLVASILSWATLLVKLRELAVDRRTLRRAAERVSLAPSLADVSDVARGNPAILRMLDEAKDEWMRSEPLLRSGCSEGAKERIAARIQGAEFEFGDRMALGLGILATVSAVTPFIGLFGTVWGIMHSFIGISSANTTSLAVVAPGIAEALLATGLGLAAAIPATLMYNALGRKVARHRAELAACATSLMCMISRDLDRAALPAGAEHAVPLTAVKPPRPSVAAGH